MGRDCLRWSSLYRVYYGAGCVGSAVGGTSDGPSVGTSVGTSVGGIGVDFGACVLVGMGSGVLVEMSVGVCIAVFVATSVFAARRELVLFDTRTEGFVPQSRRAFIQFVTRLCSTAGSHALKKS